MLFDPAHEAERSRVLHRMAGRLRARSRRVTTALGQGTDPSAFILDLIRGEDQIVVLAGGTTILGIPGSTTSDVLRFASAPTVLVGPQVQGWSGPITRLLIPIDGSAPSLRALPTAVAWAAATGAVCELVQVLDPDTPRRIGALDAVEGLEGRGDHVESAELERIAAVMEEQLGRPVMFDVLHAPASDRARAICERASEQPGTLICMATKGSRHSHSMIAGRPSVSSTSPRCPSSSRGPDVPGVIVVGIDGSAHSREALRWAVDEAAIRGATVRAVMTWSMPYAFVGLEAAVAIPTDSFETSAREELAKIVEECVPDATVRAGIEQVLHAGNPVPELLDEARTADLLVVGARGTGGVPRSAARLDGRPADQARHVPGRGRPRHRRLSAPGPARRPFAPGCPRPLSGPAAARRPPPRLSPSSPPRSGRGTIVRRARHPAAW